MTGRRNDRDGLPVSVVAGAAAVPERMKLCPPTSTRCQDGPGSPTGARVQAFGRRCRLRTRAHLQHVRTHGRREAGPLCVVSAVWPPPDGERRVGFVVSRRYSPKAVTRNRARRLLREAYRQALPDLLPAWIVLIPRYRLQGAMMQDVLAALREACRRLGLCP